MKDQDPEGFETIANCVKETYFYFENKGWYEGQLKNLCQVAIDAVSKEYPNSIYEEKLKHFINDSLFECLVEFSQPKEPYAVIGHGDTWIPNFLFHYDNHKGDSSTSPDRTRIIDFQLARYGSPILDFSLFLFSCTTQELRTSHFKQLLQVYHHSLSDFLQDLGSSPDVLFSYNAFEKEVSLYMLFGLCLSFDTVTFSVMDEEDTPNLDLIEGDEAIPLENIMHVGPIKTKHGRLRLADNVKFAIDSKYL
ncbi:hypothetical protein B7P43_G13068 [Cryptotermes secundus]|nr:hypothetical protein B7P43_G13068 [Cryptotermes secundus]PNF29699.1 hypothetical protein B7P43_G13068 [Cryptotermes secundus]